MLHEKSLTARQSRALEALLNGATQEEAAAAAGVKRQTVARWLADDGFRRKLRAAADTAVSSAAARLNLALDAAVSALRDAVESPAEKTPVRLRAADLILGHAARMTEIANLIERVQALEERLQ